MLKNIIIMSVLILLVLPVYSNCKERDRLREPIPQEEIDKYSHIKFNEKNFQKIERGMTEEQVLEFLGKPIKVKKEKRRRNRWTVHFFYPNGHVVNFKNGLVVGKE